MQTETKTEVKTERQFYTMREATSDPIAGRNVELILRTWISPDWVAPTDQNTKMVLNYLDGLGTTGALINHNNLNVACEVLKNKLERKAQPAPQSEPLPQPQAPEPPPHRENLDFVKLPSINDVRNDTAKRAQALQEQKAAEDAAKKAADELKAKEAAENITIFRANGSIDYAATQRARQQAREANGKHTTLLGANSTAADMKNASPAELRKYLRQHQHGNLKNT